MGNKGDGYADDDLQDGCSMHFDDDDLLIDLDHHDDPHADQVHDDAFVVDAAMKLLEPGGVSSLSLWAPMLVMLGACLLCMLMMSMMMMGMIMKMVIGLMTSPHVFYSYTVYCLFLAKNSVPTLDGSVSE